MYVSFELETGEAIFFSKKPHSTPHNILNLVCFYNSVADQRLKLGVC